MEKTAPKTAESNEGKKSSKTDTEDVTLFMF